MDAAGVADHLDEALGRRAFEQVPAREPASADGVPAQRAYLLTERYRFPCMFRSFRTFCGDTVLVTQADDGTFDVEVLNPVGELVDWHEGLSREEFEKLAERLAWRTD
jgi:hypothetical protein